MGSVHFSIDGELIAVLQRLLPLRTFVETGTYEGESLARARPLFDALYSAEIVERYHRAAVQRFAGDAAVELHLGDSPSMLAGLRQRLDGESVLYWLDAHWCAGGDAGESARGQCPLLDELAAIETLNDRSVVLIDDARYFLAPPPPPNHPTQWPSFDQVVDALRGLGADHAIMVLNDVFVLYPRRIGGALREFASSHAVDPYFAHLRHGYADLERAAAERLALLEEAGSARAAVERRCEALEQAASERLELLNQAVGARRAVDERCAVIEQAAEERRVLLEQVSDRKESLEGEVGRLAAALDLRDRRVIELERALDERTLELESLRRGPGSAQSKR